MVMPMPTRNLLVALAAVTALAACGGTSVGSQGMFNYSPKAPGNFGFESPSPKAQAAIGPTARPTSRPRQSAAAPPPTFPIGIYSDSTATPGFYPHDESVYVNTIIVFTNHDKLPRSVVSDAGDPASFNSGPIAPGATWKYTASVKGTFNFHDGTRPYDLGSFTVKSR